LKTFFSESVEHGSGVIDLISIGDGWGIL